MKGLTRADRTSSIGLDIGRKSIKAIQLHKRPDGKVSLAAYAIKSLPANKSVDSILHPTHYLPTLSSILHTANYGIFTGRNFAVALPSRHIFIQQNVSADEFVQQANLALGTTVEELLINTYQHNPSSSVSIATAQNIIRPHLDTLSSLGSITTTDHEFSAAIRAFGPIPQQTLLVDIGTSTTTVGVLDTHLVSTQIVDFGVHRLTSALCKKLHLSANQASELLFGSGFLPSSLQIKIQETSNEIIGELISFLQKQIDTCSPQQIILFGGGACIPGIAQYIEHLVKVPVDIGDPWKRIGKYPLKPVPRKVAPLFGTAVGLALLDLG